MLSISQIKFLKSLHKKKFRKQHGKIILEGHRLILQAVTFGAIMEKVWITDEYESSDQFKEIAKALNDFDIISQESIKKISGNKNGQGIVSLTSIPQFKPVLKYPYQSIYLDRISDPGNMGALLRTACWFGIKNILLSPECVDIYNSKVIRSGMGAHFYFDAINIMSFDDIDKENLSIIGADIQGQNLKEFSFPQNKRWILVLGSEAHGINSSIKPFLTHRVMVEAQCRMESLNVVSAGSIILNHLV